MTEMKHTLRNLFNKSLFKWGVILLVGSTVSLLLNGSPLTPQAVIFAGVFVAIIFGLILQPVPGEQLVFMGVVFAVCLRLIPLDKALMGYADPVVWLVFSAVLLSKGMTKTALGSRLSYLLIRFMGKSSLKLGYSLVLSDFILGSVMPSNGARAGAVLFPLVKSLAEKYDSKPGPTAQKLGSFLMNLVYQGDVLVCATFLTGQISNFLIINLISKLAHVEITYWKWLGLSIFPALISLIVMPLLIYYVDTPEVKHTPLAPEAARVELQKLGPMSWKEKVTLLIFVSMGVLWMTTHWHGLHFTLVAMIGLVMMLVFQILNWNDLLSEKSAWNIYFWFGGLVMLAGCLQSFGITKYLADNISIVLEGRHSIVIFALTLLIYYFAHYFFASVTAHVTAMFVPFVSVCLLTDIPKEITVLLFAYTSNLCAALTHYGTTTAPIYFGAGYMSQGKWWKIGFLCGVINLFIWSFFGIIWWKLLAVW